MNDKKHKLIVTGDDTVNIKQTLGKNVRYYRFQNQYSQQTLAELLDISVTYMSDIECGKCNVSLDLIEKIAHLFEVPYPELFKENHYDLPDKINKLHTNV